MNKITSFTDRSVKSFLRKAKERQTMFCEIIEGFHLIKLAKKSVYRYRAKVNGKLKTITLGDHYDNSHHFYAGKARELADNFKRLNSGEALDLGIEKPKLELVVSDSKVTQQSDNYSNSEKNIEPDFERYPPLVADDPRKRYHYDRLWSLVESSGFKLEPHHSESIGAWADAYTWYEFWEKEARRGAMIEREGDRRKIHTVNPAFDKLKDWEVKLTKYRKEFGVSGDGKQADNQDDGMKEFMDMVNSRKKTNA